MLGGGKDIRPRSGRMGHGIHGTGMAMVGKIRRNSPFIAPRLKRQDRLFSKGLSDPPHGGTIMSESMRMQSQLAADLEVYRAKGELIALRAENQRLREALKTAQELLCVPERNQDDEWEDRRRQVDEALQPERGKP